MEFTADELQARIKGSNMLSIAPANTPGPDSEDTPLLRYGFRIGNLGFLVPEATITEVLDKPAVFPLPRAPRWLAGMINMRGNVVPLFNLLELPGLQSDVAGCDRVLVLGQAAQAVAVYVEGLPKPLSGGKTAGKPGPLPGVFPEFTEFAFSERDMHWYEFNYQEFFQHLSTGRPGDVEISG